MCHAISDSARCSTPVWLEQQIKTRTFLSQNHLHIRWMSWWLEFYVFAGFFLLQNSKQIDI